jgi:hypothetical protein
MAETLGVIIDRPPKKAHVKMESQTIEKNKIYSYLKIAITSPLALC